MVSRGLTASEAGFRVDYTNPTQFSREFKRFFGFPPGQLVKSIPQARVRAEGSTSQSP